MFEREQALGKFHKLKKDIYELGVKAQALVNDISEETESFLSEKDFSTMDFDKVITLSKELKLLQAEFKSKVEKFNQLKDTYNFSE